jgi:hypothetical protein
VFDTSAVSWVQLGRAPFRHARTTANVATEATTAAVASMPAVRADGRVVIASTVRCQADGCGSSVIAVYRFLQHRRVIAIVCMAPSAFNNSMPFARAQQQAAQAVAHMEAGLLLAAVFNTVQT